MKKWLSDFKRDFVLLSVAYLVLGILLLVFPGGSGKVVCYVCAAILCVFGLTYLVSYFARGAQNSLLRMDFAIGLIALLVGIYVFARPEVVLSILPVVLGVVMIVDGIVKLQKALDLARIRDSYWLLLLLLAVLTAVLGVLMLVDPFATAEALIMFIGISMIVGGVSDLWTAFCISRRLRRVEKKLMGIETGDYTVSDDEEK